MEIQVISIIPRRDMDSIACLTIDRAAVAAGAGGGVWVGRLRLTRNWVTAPI